MREEWSPAQRAGIYAKYVGWIEEERENWETFALEALIIRSNLQWQWHELAPEQQVQVLQADDLLVKNHQRMGEILPAYGLHQRAEWWWFLHEGPQVREEVLQVA